MGVLGGRLKMVLIEPPVAASVHRHLPSVDGPFSGRRDGFAVDQLRGRVLLPRKFSLREGRISLLLRG